MNSLIGLLTFLSVLGLQVGRAEVAPPNILWIFTDDHATQALGAYGGRFESLNLTPNLDRIAEEGILFERAYVANSICAPSRATLLTGKHSHKNGKYMNWHSERFNHDQPQFQKVFQANGYQTAMVGKIHLAGKLQGFDYWEVLLGQGEYNDPVFKTEDGKTSYQGHSTDIITDRAIRWFKQDRDPEKPFMAMVHFKAPHRGWVPAERIRKRFESREFPEPETLFDDYEGRGHAARNQDMSISETMGTEGDGKAWRPERQAELLEIDQDDPEALTRLKYQWYMRDYLACVAGVDENIGRLLDYLDEAFLSDNTVVIYSSDQGFYLGEHGWFDKRFMYEESFRTPLVARWPGVIPPGTRSTDLVQNIDNAPTFLDIAGIEVPVDMQGVSLVPLMKGETPEDWRESLYYHYYEYPGVHNVRRHEGVATQRYKLIRYYGEDVPNGEEWELFDLELDPDELTSVYDVPANKEIINELKVELQRLRDHYEVVDESPKEKPRRS